MAPTGVRIDSLLMVCRRQALAGVSTRCRVLPAYIHFSTTVSLGECLAEGGLLSPALSVCGEG